MRILSRPSELAEISALVHVLKSSTRTECDLMDGPAMLCRSDV